MADPVRPRRWDLVRPDRLGTLLDGLPEPDLWFLDELLACAATVLVRTEGEVHFVGRSLDSLYDLLGGLLGDGPEFDRFHQLPLSFLGFGFFGGYDPVHVAQLRVNLAAGITPARLARGAPVVLADIVSSGQTFANLHAELRIWAEDERESWDVIRRKLRFLGLTRRQRTSPKTWRWQQHAAWTADLPGRAIRNISLDSAVYSYFADQQVKLTPSFSHPLWGAERATPPQHDRRTLLALSEAVALVRAGREESVRERFRAARRRVSR